MVPLKHLFHQRRRAKSLASLVFLALALIPGCKKSDEPAAQLQEAPVHVETAEVSALRTPKVLQLTGTLRGAKETDLAANVAGRILKTEVERGQSVERGALLAEVDVRAAALALEEARVQVAASKTQAEINQVDCDRFEKLKAGNAVTAYEYDQVAAKCRTSPFGVEAAEVRHSIAAKNVGDGMIRAPFAGVVTERYVEVGAYVQPSSRVVSIAEVDALRLEFSLPERNFPDVKLGSELTFEVAAYPGRVFAAQVVRISGAVRETRDVMIDAQVSNPDRSLLPGMFASVTLTIGYEDLPSVPRAAVFEQNGKQNVLVQTGNILEQRVLQTAPPLGERIAVRRGLALGEHVVTQDVLKLKNGQRVN